MQEFCKNYLSEGMMPAALLVPALPDYFKGISDMGLPVQPLGFAI